MSIEKKKNIIRWLTIIGIGDDGIHSLGKKALRKLYEAEFIFGGKRHLDLLGNFCSAKKNLWSKDFANNVMRVQALSGNQVVLLSSGNPMFYGVGSVFCKFFSMQEIEIYPHVSSFSLAAARLGWPLQKVECCSIHGRSLSEIFRFFQHGAYVMVLSNDGSSPAKLAHALYNRGFSASIITVLEHLGGEKEQIIAQEIEKVMSSTFADLNLVAIQCMHSNPEQLFSPFFVLPDNAFIHDGQFTRQNIRAIVLTHLAPQRNALLWDIGAGCGSISIEWVRLGKNTRAIAVERNPNRCQLIKKNQENLGIKNIKILEGKAPELLYEQEKPDALFIGGGLDTPDLLNSCWRFLKPGGRFVANAVTLQSEMLLSKWKFSRENKEPGLTKLLKLNLAESVPLGKKFHVWRQQYPLTILVAIKPKKELDSDISY